MKMKKILLPTALAAVSLAAGLFAGCGGQQTPVAQVTIEPRQVKLPPSHVRPLRFTWTPSAALEGEAPTVFVHLLDADRKVVRTFDHPFPQRWREGTPVSYDVDLYQSAMAPPLPPGQYRLTLGLYDKEGKRWALDGLGEPTAGRNEYDAATVEIPAGDPKPRFAFSANWLPVEPGGDRQVLARRSMASRAAIRLLDQPGPGTVWMMIRIPPVDLPDTKLVLDPGATAPSVRVVGNCGSGAGNEEEAGEGDGNSGSETSLTGPGIHKVELSMDAPPPNGFCRVHLASNFLLEPTTAAARKRSISLESIAWVPGGGRGTRRTAGAGVQGNDSPTSPQ
jgi:hypothetical protein